MVTAATDAAGSDSTAAAIMALPPTLAQALGCHDDIDSGLADYNRIRQPLGERIMLHGRKLGTHLGVNLQTDEERAMWRLLQDHRAMMDWIAVPNFLAAS